MNKDKILYWAGWVALGITTVWIILKAMGVISSPIWVEMIPYAGIVFWAGVTYQKVAALTTEMAEVKSDLKSVDRRLTNVETRVINVESKL